MRRVAALAAPTLAFSVVACALDVGCAAVTPAPLLLTSPPASQATPPGGGNLSGVWDWRHRQVREEDGNVLLEQEEWHLTQSGAALAGYYDRSVTWISDDGNPFRCNRSLRYTTYTRYTLQGTVSPTGIALAETGFQPIAPTPCDDGQRQTHDYRGAISGGDRLELAWSGGHELLVRRGAAIDPAPPSLESVDQSASGPSSMSGPVPASDAGAPTSPAGVWHWRLRSHDSDGDIKTESEEWHLLRQGDQLTGYYDRAVHVSSADGHAYACSGTPSYDTTARYQVSGVLLDDGEVEIEETADDAKPGTCDNGRRALDAYRGRVDDGRLLLFWSAGHEALEPGPASVPAAEGMGGP